MKTNEAAAVTTAGSSPRQGLQKDGRRVMSRDRIAQAFETDAWRQYGNTRAFAPPPGSATNPAVRNTKEGVMRRSICSEAPEAEVRARYQQLVRGTSRIAALSTGIVLAAVLAACGGGSSSGGGTSETGEVAGDAAGSGSGGGTGNAFAGTYNGFAKATLSAKGLPPENISGTIQIVIDDKGNVTSDPGISESGTGKLKGNSFTATVPGNRFNQPGVTCSGSMLVKGTISGNTIIGTLSGNALTCNGILIQVQGTYSATRVAAGAASRSAAGGTVMEAVRGSMGSTR